MANLRKYIYNGLRPNSPVDLYLLRAKVGEGVVDKFDPLNIKMTAKGEVFFIPFNASVEIIMPDESPKGTCKFGFQGGKPEPIEYWDEQGKLRLAKNDLYIYTESKWTWVWVKLDDVKQGWIGIWPRGEKMSEADMSEENIPAPQVVP